MWYLLYWKISITSNWLSFISTNERKLIYFRCEKKISENWKSLQKGRKGAIVRRIVSKINVIHIRLRNFCNIWKIIGDHITWVLNRNWHCLLFYLDDIIIFMRNFREQLNIIRLILKLVQNANIRLRFKSASFLVNEWPISATH